MRAGHRLGLALTLMGACLFASACSPHKDETETWQLPAQRPEGKRGEQVQYGEQIIMNTPQYLGPEATNPSLRIAGNHLSCKNCHLQAGQQANAMGFVGVSQRYPSYRGRENRVGSLAERVNGCFQRSLNGKTLPEDSAEMQAILAYMQWLSEGISPRVKGQSLPRLAFLERAADPKAGQKVYVQQCAVCHGQEGKGVLKEPQHPASGYTFPPLWGPDSYNDGAGMHRVHTAARFIHANMPLGNATLSQEEAYDVSAFINSQPRPRKANREKDYPNLQKKPVDTPYGPYADSFTETQHKYGPFSDIQAQREIAEATSSKSSH